MERAAVNAKRKMQNAKLMKACCVLRCAFGVAVTSVLVGAAPSRTADLIVTGARVWTVDKTRPTADALAIAGDRIVAVGSAQEVDKWRGPATRVIDAHGRTVLPGFN